MMKVIFFGYSCKQTARKRVCGGEKLVRQPPGHAKKSNQSTFWGIPQL